MRVSSAQLCHAVNRLERSHRSGSTRRTTTGRALPLELTPDEFLKAKHFLHQYDLQIVLQRTLNGKFVVIFPPSTSPEESEFITTELIHLIVGERDPDANRDTSEDSLDITSD